MIASFADLSTMDIYDGDNTREARKIPKDIWSVARRKLDQIQAAEELGDLRAPPSNRLEKLRGNLAGRWSIRINDQFRVVFRWEDGVAHEVCVTDYH